MAHTRLAPTDGSPKRERGWPRALLLVVVVGVAYFVGFAALVSAAKITAEPAVLVLAGLAAAVLVNGAGVALAMRRRPRGRVLAISTGVLAAVFLVTTLVPLSGAASAPAATPGQTDVLLPTGSRLAYVRLPARGQARPTPVIFVHGGPGVPDMAGDSAYFGQLTADGFDVVVYDQFGSGSSARATDPLEYTLDRHVADLDALRRHIGADRVVLIGHSFGARVAAMYTAAHGTHVAKVVYSSPSELAPEAGGDSLLPRLDFADKLTVFAAIGRPRIQLGYALLQVNPRAAHNLVGDAEMDGSFESAYNGSRPATHCPGLDPGAELRGLGFYTNQYPQSAGRPRPADPRPALARTPTPALVVKGSCDYLTWSSAIGYVRAMPAARLVYLPGAGHNAYQDKPSAFLDTVRAFLTDRPLPVPPYPGTTPPADYLGPRGDVIGMR